jgi:hypothetical protein
MTVLSKQEMVRTVMSGMESLNKEPGLTVELLNIVPISINLITSIIVWERTRTHLWKLVDPKKPSHGDRQG